MINLEETFARLNEDEFLRFERVQEPLHPRPDLCAFLVLDKLIPRPGHDMVSAAEHDEIWLDTDCTKLAEVATEADILTLIRCGVIYDEGTESLFMFA